MTPADWQRHVAQLDARQPFHDLELCHIVDGRRQWISTSGEPVFDGDRFKGYRGIVKDITERKRAEELRGLEHSVTRSLAEANGVDEALRGAIRALCLTEGWECGRYFGADDARRPAALLGGLVGRTTRRCSASWRAPRGFSFAPGEGLAGQRLAGRQAAVGVRHPRRGGASCMPRSRARPASAAPSSSP